MASRFNKQTDRHTDGQKAYSSIALWIALLCWCTIKTHDNIVLHMTCISWLFNCALTLNKLHKHAETALSVGTRWKHQKLQHSLKTIEKLQIYRTLSFLIITHLHQYHREDETSHRLRTFRKRQNNNSSSLWCNTRHQHLTQTQLLLLHIDNFCNLNSNLCPIRRHLVNVLWFK